MTNPRLDRRGIVPLLLPHFPILEELSSDDVHGFLNAQTGSNVAMNEDNASAFDTWRRALASQGYEGVWDLTPAQEAAIRQRGDELKALADAQRGRP